MKIRELLVLSDTGVLVRFAGLSLPAAYTFQLAMWKKKVEPELLSAIEARLAAAEKHGEEKDGSFHIPERKQKAFSAEMTPVLEQDVDDPPRISLDKITGNLSAADAERLLSFVEMGPAAAPAKWPRRKKAA